MADGTLRPVGEDSRGILDPALLRRRLSLTRYPPGELLAGLVDRFWAVDWDLPPGTTHRQQVLGHPGANLSVGSGQGSPGHGPGPLEAMLNGVEPGLDTRLLVGAGWTVAAMTTPGGLGALVRGSAAAYTGRVVPLGPEIGTDDDGLIARVSGESTPQGRVALLRTELEDRVAAADPERVRRARRVAAVARIAETDRSVRGLEDLSARAGLSPRSLQRLFAEYAGVSPTWVLRRYRVLEVAERVRTGRRVSWADVAVELGYADQAHLTRDFHAATGQTPAAYAESQAGQAQDQASK